MVSTTGKTVVNTKVIGTTAKSTALAFYTIKTTTFNIAYGNMERMSVPMMKMELRGSRL